MAIPHQYVSWLTKSQLIDFFDTFECSLYTSIQMLQHTDFIWARSRLALRTMNDWKLLDQSIRYSVRWNIKMFSHASTNFDVRSNFDKGTALKKLNILNCRIFCVCVWDSVILFFRLSFFPFLIRYFRFYQSLRTFCEEMVNFIFTSIVMPNSVALFYRVFQLVLMKTHDCLCV